MGGPWTTTMAGRQQEPHPTMPDPDQASTANKEAMAITLADTAEVAEGTVAVMETTATEATETDDSPAQGEGEAEVEDTQGVATAKTTTITCKISHTTWPILQFMLSQVASRRSHRLTVGVSRSYHHRVQRTRPTTRFTYGTVPSLTSQLCLGQTRTSSLIS